jgi:GTP-binding protein EngB required for normal cell division
VFHACDDELVSYSSAIALYRKLEQTGNSCELISIEQGGYGYATASPEWKQKVRTKVEAFLKKSGLLPVVS